MTSRPTIAAALALAALAPALSGPPAAAQGIVQPLPSAAEGELQQALQTLARSPEDLEALRRAGFASLELEDDDAALGFFSRAQQVAPGDGRVLLGLAVTRLRQRDPYAALTLFERAEGTDIAFGKYAADHALAYDLIGQNAAAQTRYALALTREDDPVVRRRLALSQAIGGDLQAAEATLLPLLQQGDRPAFRTRAFVLAIADQTQAAQAIADTVLPARVASALQPYLDAMPRLTRAQQAAAANFGIFPPLAEIGRDSPRTLAAADSATIAPPARQQGGADERLAPRGEALGGGQGRRASAAAAEPERAERSARRQTRAERREAERRMQAGSVEVRDAVRIEPEAPPVAVAVADRAPAVRQAATPAPAPAEPTAELPAQVAAVELPPSDAVAAELPPVAPLPDVAVDTASAPLPAPGAELESDNGATIAIADPQVAPEPAVQPEPPVRTALPGLAATPGFDLARVDPSAAPQPPVAADPAPMPPAMPEPPASAAPESLAEAFADLAPAGPVAPAAGAVDISSFEAPRERPAPPPDAAPAPPAEPARHWAQVATGRDRSALRFDWRRLSRNAPELLGERAGYVMQWGETNRLLVGPFPTAAAARAFVNDLVEAGIDSFPYSSEEGEAAERLP